MLALKRRDSESAGAYYSWRAMRARCANPLHAAHKNYGGRVGGEIMKPLMIDRRSIADDISSLFCFALGFSTGWVIGVVF